MAAELFRRRVLPPLPCVKNAAGQLGGRMRYISADRIGGIVTILAGGIALAEAVRLYPTRVSLLVGDHTMPAVVGFLMAALGVLLLFAKGSAFHVEFPDRKTMLGIIGTVGFLLVYWILFQFVGYVISTFIASVLLFRMIGSYPLFPRALLFGAALTAFLYVAFVYLLSISFPKGLIGI
ncbi:tripartite tricarboxylate transporter TctB family protein [Geobacillus subterraneus]|uniref:tripartite tricarboxylate transporter TctB family protein n=1 Tax=Geobacillus subterraneus TaxID=129338 RepID=UPI001442BC2E|nr:tripartite tricarboxylate transporter TctB family protein [Geobacillus subterraneus]QIZ66172.1 tripartite tricarboxylate transporter TctB family protein [Geobacillus subterraneus]WPZ18374.1 tripartite tricarboxylate transporter TctB family protein [Geobacillus subterraneus]